MKGSFELIMVVVWSVVSSGAFHIGVVLGRVPQRNVDIVATFCTTAYSASYDTVYSASYDTVYSASYDTVYSASYDTVYSACYDTVHCRIRKNDEVI